MQASSTCASQAHHFPSHQQGEGNSVWETDILFTPETLQFIPVILKHVTSEEKMSTLCLKQITAIMMIITSKNFCWPIIFVTFTGFINSHKHLPKYNNPKMKLSKILNNFVTGRQTISKPIQLLNITNTGKQYPYFFLQPQIEFKQEFIFPKSRQFTHVWTFSFSQLPAGRGHLTQIGMWEDKFSENSQLIQRSTQRVTEGIALYVCICSLGGTLRCQIYLLCYILKGYS